MANVTITQLPAADTLTGAELVPVVQNGVTVQTTTADIAASPSLTQTFLTVTNAPSLANSRYFSVGTGLGLTDNGAQSNLVLNLNGTSGSLELAGNGVIVKTASNTITARTLTASGNGLSITNGDGVSGNPTFALTGLPEALSNLTGGGFLVSLDPNTILQRSIAGTANEITVADGDGLNGTPTIGLADNPVLPGTEGVALPSGTTAQRAAVPPNGTIRYNSDLAVLEGYANNTWGSIAVGVGVTSVDVSGGTTGLTTSGGPITSTGTITFAGTLITSNGGTGLSSYTAGDIVYYATGTAFSKLAIGTNGQVMTSSGTAPQWTAQSSLSVGSATTATNVAGGATNQIVYNTAGNTSSFIVAPTVANTYLEWSGSAFQWSANPLGTVTSVGLAMPVEFTVTNSPVTSSGTLTAAWGSQTQNYFLAAPNGTSGTPSFRAVVAADIPTLNQNTTGSAGSVANAVTFNTSGGAVAGTTFNGSAPVTVDYSTIGAPKTDGTNATGTWSINISGNAATATASTNVSGGAANQIVYNTAAATTAFITAPTVASTVLQWSGSAFQWVASSTGTVTSVDVSGGTTGLTFSGGPITSSGTITMAGTLAIANGGTNASATPTAGAIAYGTGTAYAFSAVGNSGDVFTSAGAGAPGWTAQSALAVGSATNATNTTNVAITDDTSTNATMYPVWVTANTGNLPAKVTSTKLSFNPSTGVLTATGGITGGTF